MASERAEELRRSIPLLSDLGDDDLEWLVEHGEFLDYAAGERLFGEGERAEHLYMYLRGEMHVRRSDSGDVARYIGRAGMVGGVLPYSRMQTYMGVGYAIEPTRVYRLARTLFPELLHRIPTLGERLVGAMTDRVREMTMSDVNREKLMALGKLSAGLAHELNNPAAATYRAAQKLCQTLGDLRRTARALVLAEVPAEGRRAIIALEEEGAVGSHATQRRDPLERADAESELTSWLESHGVAEPWQTAPVLADAGIGVPSLARLASALDAQILGIALERVVAAISVQRLAEDIESASVRISELVRSIKEYSYMDQAPIQSVDVHRGLESTLTILGHKLKKKSISIARDFDPALPAIEAYGAELNQVWTNLIDNAIDAMHEGGQLRLRTVARGEAVVVEVMDDGSGIPADVRPHIFEPFFTTKSVGEGTGLGLDAVFRIVQKHHGAIEVDSQPGRTTFTIRLPHTLTARA